MKHKFRLNYSPKQLRNLKVEEIKKELSTAKSLVLFTTDQVPHQDLENLRKKLVEVHASLRFVKNTLFRVAAAEMKLPESLYADTILTGSTAVMFIQDEDFVAALKVLKEVFGKNENVKIKIGFIDNDLYDSSKVLEFARIPTKTELYTKLVGSLQSPVYGLYNALTSDLRKLAYALQAISSKIS